MKLTKKILKSVVKECLLEIFSEGFTASKETSKKEFNKVVNEVSTPRRKSADLISYQNNVRQTSQSLTSDPVLSSIFEDTAMTTLQEQRNGAEGLQASDRASYVAATNDPSDLFGEAAEKWANLAFSDNKNK